MLRVFYFFILLCCILPTFLGLSAVVSASFSFIPSLGLTEVNWQGFMHVLHHSGIETSLTLTVVSSLASTFLACFICFAILQSCWGTVFWKKIQWCLSPLLSMPHVAFAIGFAFLFSPTGFGMRVIAQLTEINLGTELPLLIQDPYALGLSLMLALREVPFLLLMSMAVLSQIDVVRLEKISTSLGYNRAQTWWKVILPQWLVRMRFSIFAVLAYGLSVVDVPLILGPTNPPTFALRIWQWFNEPNLAEFPKAAAGAVIMLVIAMSLMGLLRLLEWVSFKFFRYWQISGRYLPSLPGKRLFGLVAGIFAMAVLTILVWTFAQRWRFPDLLPSQYSISFWQQEWNAVFSTIEQSLFIALIAATFATLMAIAAQEYRILHRFHLPNSLIAIPILIPQLSVLLGVQVAILYLNSHAFSFWVIWSHVFFAFPYVYLSLDGAFQSYDMRLTHSALSLGKSPIQVWFRIKLPLLLSAIAFAWAVGISVSLAQYLPTLMLGAGRVATLTTEAVALSSGFDRRITAIYALWQALLPLIFFSLALSVQFWQRKYHRIQLKGFIKNDTYPKKSQHLQKQS